MPHRSTQRVVLIGASNLARAFPLIAHGLPRGLAGPLDILAAFGHGRSLGIWSRVPGRSLPGLVECDLWRELGRHGAEQPPPLAAITDVGNDLMYGADVDRILGWLECCLDRLARRRSRIVLLSLPMASLARLTPGRFALLRGLLFPTSPITWPLLWERLAALDAGMRRLGPQYGAHWLDAAPDWYGFDLIHIRRPDQPRAWGTVFSGWRDWDPAVAMAHPAWARSMGVRRLRPAERYLLGIRQITPQPVIARPGLRIFLY